MFDSPRLSKTPLSIEEIEEIDSSGLPLIVKHKIRIFAHCLSCFKAMSSNTFDGEYPSYQERLNWLLDQPALRHDKEFVFILLEQLEGAERYLNELAHKCNISPLQLTLKDLIDESLKSESFSS